MVAEKQADLVIGIDVGSAHSLVGHIGKGCVDIVQNEISQRQTPTLVGFTDRDRLLGDEALTHIKSNMKNTCRNFKHLLGQQFTSPITETEAFWSTCNLAADRKGFCGYSVNHKGKECIYSGMLIMSMFLTELKKITETWCQGSVADVVIAVPSYYSDIHRIAMLDAAKIAGLNVLSLMNEHTATALAYGIYRSNDFDPEKPMTVVFCSMGHVVFSVAIVQFTRGKLWVLYERSAKVGGRDMDECLMRKISTKFETLTGCNPLSNTRAKYKLEEAIWKTKKTLSSNSQANITCECLLEDHDLSMLIERAEFLEVCKPMMNKVSEVLEAAKAAYGLPTSSIDVIEMVGGASRVPWVKEMCSKAFGKKELSMTLNADECVARGCTLQAAMLSSLYKVREFKVEEVTHFPISIGWTGLPSATDEDGDIQMVPGEKCAEIYPANSPTNLVKWVTFYRKMNFKVNVRYTNEDLLLPGTPKELGSYFIDMPSQTKPKKVKLKTVLTRHGTFGIQSAHMLEEEENNPDTNGIGGMTEFRTENGHGEEGTRQGTKRHLEDGHAHALNDTKEKRIKRTEVVVIPSHCPGLSADELKKLVEDEEVMRAEERETSEANARRNDLESYVFNMRSNIAEGAKYGDCMTEADREEFMGALKGAEEWLYEHTEEGKSVFVEKLAELKVFGDPVEMRHKDEIRRGESGDSLQKLLATYQDVTQNLKYTHVDAGKLKAFETSCNEVARKLEVLRAEQSQLAKYEKPILETSWLEKQFEELSNLAKAVLHDSGDSGFEEESDAPAIATTSCSPLGTPYAD